MPTASLISDSTIPDCGGVPVTIKVDWTVGVDTPFTPAAKCRVALLKLTAPATYTHVQYLHSGRPQQVYQGSGPGDTEEFVIYPVAPDESNASAHEVSGGVLVPTYHWLRGYPSARLASGVYWARVLLYDGAGTWNTVGDPVPVRVLPRNRFNEVYTYRRDFPSPPYTTGPQGLDEEG